MYVLLEMITIMLPYNLEHCYVFGVFMCDSKIRIEKYMYLFNDSI